MTGLRLIDHDFHFIRIKDCTDFVDWIRADTAEAEMAKFIRSLPTGAIVTFGIQQGSAWFQYQDYILPVSLAAYMASEDIGNIMASVDEQVEMIKVVWSADEYNHWLRYDSGIEDDLVYPAICSKCGCLMSCSRIHFENRGHTWGRVRCTDSACGHVEIMPDFLDRIRGKNITKLVKQLAREIEDHGYDVTVLPYALSIEHTGCYEASNGHELPCRECGGEMRPWRIITSCRHRSTMWACSQCFGSLSVASSHIAMDEERLEAIERSRKTEDPELE